MAERARGSAEQQDCFTSRQRVLQNRAAFEQRFMEQLGITINAVDSAAGKPAGVLALTLLRHGEENDTSQAPEPSPRERRIEQHLRELPFGSWFEFIDPTTGQIARRKLAWYPPMSGRCLMVSRRGQRGEEMSLAQLAHEVAA